MALHFPGPAWVREGPGGTQRRKIQAPPWWGPRSCACLLASHSAPGRRAGCRSGARPRGHGAGGAGWFGRPQGPCSGRRGGDTCPWPSAPLCPLVHVRGGQPGSDRERWRAWRLTRADLDFWKFLAPSQAQGEVEGSLGLARPACICFPWVLCCVPRGRSTRVPRGRSLP